MSNTASSLWPRQKHCLKRYFFGMVIILLAFIHVAQVMGEEKTISTGPSAAAESIPPAAPAPMTDIHDIQPPVPVGFDAPWLLPVLLTGIAVAILAALWWWWKKHRKQQTIETLVPELPPEMTAMQALDQISDVRRFDGKTFYYRLSTILRRYVHGRFAVGAQEMTTEEFLPCIDRLPIERELARQLKGVSRAMDPVKFGGEMATEKQMEADLFFARGFVRNTTQQIDIDEEKNDGEQHASFPMIDTKSKKQIPNFK